MQLYLMPDKDELTYHKINCIKQPGGTECGYMSLAMAGYILSGGVQVRTKRELAQVQFDVARLPKWVVDCIDNQKWTDAPIVQNGRGRHVNESPDPYIVQTCRRAKS